MTVLRYFICGLVCGFVFSAEASRSQEMTNALIQPALFPAGQIETNDSGAALLEAAKYGDMGLVEKLLLQGAKVDTGDAKGWTPLIFAAQSGNEKLVQILIAHGADVNRRTSTETGSTVLCFAVEGGNLNVIQDLLNHGAVINGKARDGLTPLIFAAAHGQTKQAEFLISRGADVNLYGLVDNRGATWSPLMAAANVENFEMLELLLKNGAEINATNNRGDTTLMELSKRSHPLLVKFLIAKGANVNARGPRGHTALIYAAYNGIVENIRLLLAAGADPFATATDDDDPHSQNRYGAVDLARQQGHPDALAIIQDAQTRLRPQPPGSFNAEMK